MLKRDDSRRGRFRAKGRCAARGGAKAFLLLALALGLWGHVAAAQEAAPAAAGEVCAKSEFESAVDETAEKLRELNNTHRPTFQAKLRQLKEKRGWSNDQFLKEAAPFVKDDRITVYDDKTNDLLASISTMGQEGANASEPNCKMLADLRAMMGVLIETQSAKWTYMFEKLDGALGR